MMLFFREGARRWKIYSGIMKGFCALYFFLVYICYEGKSRVQNVYRKASSWEGVDGSCDQKMNNVGSGILIQFRSLYSSELLHHHLKVKLARRVGPEQM